MNKKSLLATFILILFYICSAFSITMLISYFIERKVYIPLFSIILSIPLIYVFNSSAFVIIILITIFSFLSYGLSAILK